MIMDRWVTCCCYTIVDLCTHYIIDVFDLYRKCSTSLRWAFPVNAQTHKPKVFTSNPQGHTSGGTSQMLPNWLVTTSCWPLTYVVLNFDLCFCSPVRCLRIVSSWRANSISLQECVRWVTIWLNDQCMPFSHTHTYSVTCRTHSQGNNANNIRALDQDELGWVTFDLVLACARHPMVRPSLRSKFVQLMIGMILILAYC